MVKVAHWDTQNSGPPPRVLGEIRGTPTIRLFKPKLNQGDSTKKKVVLDYNMERKAKDMKQFVEYNMPSFIEQIDNMKSLEKFQAKATKYGLPQAILFTSKAKTASMTKYLSTEFRRRLLIGQVFPTKPNQAVMEQFDVKDLPALIVVTINGEIIKYEGDGFTKNKLYTFLSKYALKEKVPIKPKQEKETADGGAGDHSEF